MLSSLLPNALQSPGNSCEKLPKIEIHCRKLAFLETFCGRFERNIFLPKSSVACVLFSSGSDVQSLFFRSSLILFAKVALQSSNICFGELILNCSENGILWGTFINAPLLLKIYESKLRFAKNTNLFCKVHSYVVNCLVIFISVCSY